MGNVVIAPDADDTDGNWTTQVGGTSLFAVIDEASADDADYIESGDNPSADKCKIRLSDPAQPMLDPMSVSVRVKKSGNDAISLVIRLVEGTTVRAAWTSELTDTWTTVTNSLSAGQRAAITDFTNLYVELEASVSVPLLDTYTNAIVAYSFRKLRSAYAGSAVRIRESGGNTEQDIGFAADGSFDADAAASFIGANSGFIVKWYDQSGNGNDASEATAGLQPGYAATGINGLPSASHSIARLTRMTSNSLTFSSGQTAATGLVVAALSSGVGNSYLRILSFAQDAQAADWNNTQSFNIARGVGSVVSLGCNSTGSGDVGITLGAPFRGAGFITSGSNLAFWLNGATSSSGTPTTLGLNTSSTVRVGWSPTGDFWDGPIGEAIIYFSDQSSNLTGIDNNMKSGWGF